jgi:signal transduction histidine kinase
MKQFQNAIRESNRKLNLLSSITRHDVANQLTVVQGYTQLAALRKPDPVTTDFLAKIASAVDMIQHQIEFTRTYQDLGAQAPAWFRVEEAIQSVQPPEISLDCTCNSYEIFADPMIAKVFFNLFDNAVRYGGRVTTITARCERVGDKLVITFADNGIGIPLNEKQKIFKKGFGQHTGFGLFLAREILAITGISIHETGTHGKGARFEITVPEGAYRSV